MLIFVIKPKWVQQEIKKNEQAQICMAVINSYMTGLILGNIC